MVHTPHLRWQCVIKNLMAFNPVENVMKKLGLAIALAMGLGSLAAGAAPMAATAAANAPTAQAPGAWGHGGHRHERFRAQLEKLHSDLHLSAQQEQAWQRIRTSQRHLREQMRAHHREVAQVMRAELAKAHPDLARVAAAQDRGQARLRTERKAVRTEMLAFYQHLSPQQQTTVRDFLRQRIAQRHHRHQAHERAAQGNQ
jgi:Spy/CpxP family protein refolding chaperone